MSTQRDEPFFAEEERDSRRMLTGNLARGNADQMDGRKN